MRNPTAFAEKQRRAISTALLMTFSFALSACQPNAPLPKPAPATPLATKFDPKATGTIRGQILWSGPLPKIDPIKLPIPPPGAIAEAPNPNAPIIDPKSLGMNQVLVYLRNVDPARSRPWPHEPVEVAFDKSRLEIRQGKFAGRIGIVRRGDDIACISREKTNSILEARGASVFSIPLIDPDKTTRRRLNDSGILELSSGSALFWLRAHLWIGEHPYATLTDAAGAFELPQVPAGNYELVCWSPNWKIKRRERHPEFGEIERLIFEDALQQASPIAVTAGETAAAIVRWK